MPYGANDPLYDKDIGFYLFSLPAYVAIKNWMLLTLFLSALFAGAVYWVHGDIQYDAHRRQNWTSVEFVASDSRWLPPGGGTGWGQPHSGVPIWGAGG